MSHLVHFSYSWCKGTPFTVVLTRFWSEWGGFLCAPLGKSFGVFNTLWYQKEGGHLREPCLYRAGQWWKLLWGQIKKSVTHGALGTRCISHLICHTLTCVLKTTTGPLGTPRVDGRNLTGSGHHPKTLWCTFLNAIWLWALPKKRKFSE